MKRIIIQCPYCGFTQNCNRYPYCDACTKEFLVQVKISKLGINKCRMCKSEFEEIKGLTENNLCVKCSEHLAEARMDNR